MNSSKDHLHGSAEIGTNAKAREDTCVPMIYECLPMSMASSAKYHTAN